MNEVHSIKITRLPLTVILSERSESKDLLNIRADPSAALGMTIFFTRDDDLFLLGMTIKENRH